MAFSDCGKGQILVQPSLLQEYLKGIPSDDKSFVEKEIEENQKHKQIQEEDLINTNNIITTSTININNEAERMMLSIFRNNITNSHKSGLI